MNFNKLYEDIFKPASAEEVIRRKEQSRIEELKEFLNNQNVKYTEDDKGNIININKEDAEKRNKYGNSLLNTAISRADIYLIKLLINSGVDVNTYTGGGITSLMLAMFILPYPISLDIIKLLLDNGADPNLLSLFSRHTSLDKAFGFKQPDIIINLLKKYGAKTSDELKKGKIN